MSLVYRTDVLTLAGISLIRLAGQFGTPLYVYSQGVMQDTARTVNAALTGSTPHLICYAVKANPNLAVIQTFARMGIGTDVTSAGELARARHAGVPPQQIVFSGVGKTPEEMRQAVNLGVKGIHVESDFEIAMLAEIASASGTEVPIALRVNPDIDPQTHPHIATGLRSAKFGIPWQEIGLAISTLRQHPGLRLAGISMHIGSQVMAVGPFREAARRLAGIARELLSAGERLEYIDFGGGVGVHYDDECPPDPSEWGAALRGALGDLPLALVVEPGRLLVASAGVLLTRVLGVKRSGGRTFVIVDAGMNDLLRPALYGAFHPIVPVQLRPDEPDEPVDIVGPVCETTDAFARDRLLPVPRQGDYLAILQAGAYGSSMASTYNSRRRPAEVMITADRRCHLIRARDELVDLYRGEYLLDEPPEVSRG